MDNGTGTVLVYQSVHVCIACTTYTYDIPEAKEYIYIYIYIRNTINDNVLDLRSRESYTDINI